MPFGGGAFTDDKGDVVDVDESAGSPMPFGGGAFTDT